MGPQGFAGGAPAEVIMREGTGGTRITAISEYGEEAVSRHYLTHVTFAGCLSCTSGISSGYPNTIVPTGL